MPPGQIVSHLENILGQEQINFEVPALRLLAQGAQGSMRDALSLTDQAIAYAAGQVTLDAVQGMLGSLDQSYLVRMLDALAAREAQALLAIADEMAARSLSWSSALQDLGTLLNRIAIAQAVPAAVPNDLPEHDDIVRLAPMFTPEDVQLFYQIVVHGRHELGLAPDEYSGFTMTLLRMLAFVPVDGGGITTAAPGGGHAQVTSASSGSSAAAATATSTSVQKPASRAMAALKAAQSNKLATPATSIHTVNTDEGAMSVANANGSNGGNGSMNGSSSGNTEKLPTAVKALSASAIDWPALVKQLELRGVARQLAMQSELLSCEDDGQLIALRVRVPVETLLSAGSKDKLAAALSEHLGKKVRLDTEIGATTQTAHAADVADEAERLRHAEQTLQEDPFVQTLIRDFGATIVPGSVRPL